MLKYLVSRAGENGNRGKKSLMIKGFRSLNTKDINKYCT